MNTMIELDTMAASQIFGGKDEQTAQIVEFIAEKLPIILIIALHLFFRKDILPNVGIYP